MESPISSLIPAADKGDFAAAEALFAALYSELHRLSDNLRGMASRDLERDHASAE